MVLITTTELDDNHNHNHNHRRHNHFHHDHHRPTTAPSQTNHNHNHNRNRNGNGRYSNFTSLPCFTVKWGRQVHLRCVKESSDDDDHDDHDDHDSESLTRSEFDSLDVVGGRKRRRSSDDDGGIKAMREKLMLDFRLQAAKMQAAFLNKTDAVSPSPHSTDVDLRPWNLRTRRAVCKDPNNSNSNSNNVLESPARLRVDVKSPVKRSGGDEGGGCNEGPRAKFKRSLTKSEIEEDFVHIMGTRPVRRPKKRPKIVQRQIDAISPGFWLSEITSDMYKVNEQA